MQNQGQKRNINVLKCETPGPNDFAMMKELLTRRSKND